MKFEFIKQDGSTLDFSTKTVTVEKVITATVKVPLWSGIGKHIPFDKLAEIGLSIKYTPDQTQERLNYEKVTFMYNHIPEFATRVQELKAKYDQLGVPYNCTVADISAALMQKFDNNDDRATFLAEFNSLLDKGVKLNYQAGMRLYCGYEDEDYDPVDDFVMWTDFPMLVQWLPGTYEEKDIPAKLEPEIITTAEREAEIMASL